MSSQEWETIGAQFNLSGTRSFYRAIRTLQSEARALREAADFTKASPAWPTPILEQWVRELDELADEHIHALRVLDGAAW